VNLANQPFAPLKASFSSPTISMPRRRRRYGVFDQPIGRLEQCGAGSLTTLICAPRPASSPASRPITAGLDGAGECHAFGHGDSVDKRAPHAPASARDHPTAYRN
jgi:hypothetical protein